MVLRASADRLEDLSGARVHRLAALDELRDPNAAERRLDSRAFRDGHDTDVGQGCCFLRSELQDLLLHVIDLDLGYVPQCAPVRQCVVGCGRVDVDAQEALVADNEERVAELLQMRPDFLRRCRSTAHDELCAVTRRTVPCVVEGGGLSLPTRCVRYLRRQIDVQRLTVKRPR